MSKALSYVCDDIYWSLKIAESFPEHIPTAENILGNKWHKIIVFRNEVQVVTAGHILLLRAFSII